MLKPIALANAFTTVALALYVICRLLVLIVPDFLFSIARSWFHTFSMESLRGTVPFDIGTFLFGAVTLAVVVWVTTYAGAKLYNRFSQVQWTRSMSRVPSEA